LPSESLIASAVCWYHRRWLIKDTARYRIAIPHSLVKSFHITCKPDNLK
jgi:hypothetical protein